MLKTIALWYQIIMESTIRRLRREYLFRKRIKEHRKKDPHIY
jgi:hypothetical protein